jgi:hypothetical protein
MFPYFWLLLYGDALASIFVLAGHFAFNDTRFFPQTNESFRVIFGSFRSWKEIAKRALMIVCVFTVMILTLILLLRWGMSLRMYAFAVTGFVLFNASKMSFFRNLSRRWVYSLVFSLAVSCAWFFYPHWTTTGFASFLLAFFFLVLLRRVKFKEASLLAIAIIIFDISMVFLSDFMIEFAADASSTPLGFALPPVLWFIGVKMIGLADIVLPGILLMTMFREAKNRLDSSLFIYPMIAYFIGLSVAITMRNVFDSAQPATLYLFPAVLIGFWIAILIHHIPFVNVLRGTE